VYGKVIPGEVAQALVLRPGRVPIKVLESTPEVIDKPQVRARVTGRIDRLVVKLQQPLRIGEGAILLGRPGGGQQEDLGLDLRWLPALGRGVPESCRLGLVEVDRDQPIELGQGPALEAGVGATVRGVLPEHDEAFDLAVRHRRRGGDVRVVARQFGDPLVAELVVL
jgi:hypothetical protein